MHHCPTPTLRPHLVLSSLGSRNGFHLTSTGRVTQLLKPLKKYPSSNQPLKCQDCSGGRNPTPMFVPAYNMLEHCKQAHDLHNDEERADELKKYGVSAIEKKNVVKLFKINP